MADLVAIEPEGAFERVIAGDGAEHEEDGGRFGAVVELIVSGDKGLTGLCGSGRKS